MKIFSRKKQLLLENKTILIAFSIIIFIIISITSSLFYIKKQKLPAISDLKTIEFYSQDQVKFFELNNEQTQTYVTLPDISQHMISAILSIEDQHFYEHNGFDYRRIVKSIIDNVSSMSKKYGASTITQQYARNLYLSHKKSIERKVKEAYYTLLLEQNYTKDEILEGYLNTIYFGHGIYGIGDASQFYFGKDPKDLTIAESAVLASIPKAPTFYSPITHFEKNTIRKELVLAQMLSQNKITQEEYDEALNEEIVIIGKHPQSVNNMAPYFQDIVMHELEKFDLVQDQFFKGIKVYTTLDTHLNHIVEEAINKTYSPYSEIETAVFAMDPQTGFVKAVIGGRDYRSSQYNRAVTAKRQTGSTIKPLLYYSALEYGFTPTTTFRSEPTTFYINKGSEKYAPGNFANIYANEDVTMAYALAVSDNIYAVKTHLFLGEDTLIKTAHRLGITSDMLAVPSLALGTTEIKLSEMTNAYAHFANLGKKVRPVYITKITDLNDQVLYEYVPIKQQILNPDLCFIMNHMLRGMFDTNMSYRASVTGLSIAYRITHPYAGKSGSTDYDNIMIGYNPNLVLGVWTGYDTQKPIELYDEKTYSKRLWVEIMEDYFKHQKTSWYQPSKNISTLVVNPITGEVANRYTKEYTKLMYYIKGTEPIY
ncbi:PBP1A family penicillin-binding protein [Mycoplasmatota bacterium]|nr:PBP1A family penicillin-binding protein [Mycoplasmatota bacterium]